jgi:D-lactate dehydrogenase
VTDDEEHGMRATFYEIEEDWEQEYLRRRFLHVEPVFVARPLTAETVSETSESTVASVFIHSRVSRELLGRMPGLRLLTTRSTGFDHIDVQACAERGVTIANVPRYGENTVAEHTFGLILNLSRNIHRAFQRTRARDFSLAGLEGRDLRSKTLGVIGAGSIGLHVIRMARAFGMKVLAHDTRPQSILSEVLEFDYAPLGRLLAASDIVTLHAPLLPETRHLLNRERFQQMKRGAFLVNTGRGALVDTDALLWALDEGIVAGAGLDVLEGEEQLLEEHHMFRGPGSEAHVREVVRGHQLFERDNVIVTPHIAWFSREARERILDTTAETIEAFAAGQRVNTVAAP